MSVPEPIVTRSQRETEAVGQALATRLRVGDVVLIEGELGAGKTTLVRGMVQGLGADPSVVTSPTFTLLHEYRGGRVPLYHADLYRLEPADVEDLGLEETLRDGALVIEWPDRYTHRGPAAIRVRLEADGAEADTRRIAIDG